MTSRVRLAAWTAVGVLGGGLVTGVAVSELGVATAASPSPAPRAGTHDGQQRPGPFGPGGHRGGALLGALGGRVLHGQATVQTRNGKTEVVTVQSGTISDISTDHTTITVTSSDGFPSTYMVNSSTRIVLNGTQGAATSLKKGDTVRVLAVHSASGNVARAVLDGVPPHPRGGMAPPAPPA